MQPSEKAKANEIKMTITQSAPRISKIEMKAQGTEGLVITYSTTEIRNGIGSPATDVSTKKRPVQKELRVLFDQLKEHMLRCLGYHWANDTVLEMYKSNVVASYVLTNDDNRFMIGGKVTVKENTGAINTPLFSPDSYDEMDELTEIISQIKNEAKLFMNGKGADTKQVVVEYLKATNKDVIDADGDYDKMSEEERDAAIKEAFEHYNLEIIEEGGKQVIAVKEAVEVTAEQVESGESQAIIQKAKASKKDKTVKEAASKAPVDVTPKMASPVVKSEPEDHVPLFDESDDDSPVF